GEVLDEWLDKDVSNRARPQAVRQLFDREFGASIPTSWKQRPIGDIRKEDCSAVIRALASRGIAAQAHVMHGNLRRLFNWAVGFGQFGLDDSPMRYVKPKLLIGKRVIREHVLNDGELKSIWSAADQLGYPVGPIVKLLMLTGQRLNDIAQLSWTEVDLDQA